ncbi:MAG: hypothetical protein DMF84_19470 [Acidobacteria bacterium]|nr:MAG: hypothetical protein DMF84_19470 [Acidobacteriota bacterium]
MVGQRQVGHEIRKMVASMNLLRDIRYGVRVLIGSPAFAAASVAVMALGVGVSTAVFSVMRGVLVTPLPYHAPDRIVLFRADVPGYVHEPALTADELSALRERTDLFESVAVINESEGNLTSPDDMAAVTAASISENFFQTLGVAPLLGRSVSYGDFGEQWIAAVDISYEAWQRHFQGDPRIIGRRIEVNNIPVTVVGVLPPGFHLYLGPGVTVSTRVDIWYPRSPGYDRDPFRGHVVIARLRDGVALETTRAAVSALAANLVVQHPSSYATGPVRLSLNTLDRDVVSEVKPALTAIAGAVTFVLLIACANLANLLLARASARERELGVRIAIGASRRDIVRQLLAEGLVVGSLGACGGLLLAAWGVDVLVRLAPAVLPHLDMIRIDNHAAAFAVVVSVVCAVVVSLVPALHVTKGSLADRMKRDLTSQSGSRLRGALVASQLALSLVLLVGAGLMVRTFISMRAVPLGFDPSDALTMNVALQLQRFGTGPIDEASARTLAFYHQLAEAVRDIPGAEQVGIGLPVPLRGIGFIAERFAIDASGPQYQADGVLALAGFLETLRVPLVAGRYFTVADDDRPVVILDQRLAEQLWPHQSAIGRRLLLKSLHEKWVEVAGVVAHVQMQDVRHKDPPQIWMTYATESYSELNIVVRARNASALISPVKNAVQRLGAGRPVHDVALLDDYVADATADTRFALLVLFAFAAIAVILAAIGVYGVVAFATARRSREIAVRIALGADARGIVALVLRDGLAWIAAGLLTGIGGALVLSRYLGALLFRIGDRDPITFATVAVLLAAVALLATALPAVRAVWTDPMLALRAE